MIAVALPEIREDFDVGHNEVGWLVTAYLIAMAIAQPIGGRLADQIGRSLTFRFGLITFLIFSLAAALAPNFHLLIALRTGQALCGAVVIPSGMALLRTEVSDERLGEAVGLLGAIVGISAAGGPLLGGGIVELGSWRLMFLMNLPLVGLALAAQLMLGVRDSGASGRARVDLAGAALLAALLTLFSYLLGSGAAEPPALMVGLGVLLVLLLAVFIRSQMRTAVPVADWPLFRLRTFSAATAYVLLSNMVMYTTLLSVPFFVKEVQGRSAGETGLLLGSMSILMAALAPLAGRLSDKRGRRLPALAGGLAQLVAALLLLTGVNEASAFVFIALTLALLGLGVGLGSGPAMTAAVEAAPAENAGTASGTASMTRYLGSITGAAILGSALSEGDPSGSQVFQLLWGLMAVMAAISVLAASQMHAFRRESSMDTARSKPGGA